MSVTSAQGKPGTAAGLADYRGAEVTANFGDSRAELRALLLNCGIFDMAWQAKLVLTGEDRVRWLNGMVTNNIRDLAPGRGVYSFLLSAQGRIQGEMVAYNRGDHLLITTDRQQAPLIAATFDRYIIMDDVEVSDVSDKLGAIGVAGPTAGEVLGAPAFDVGQLAKGQVTDLVWQDIGVSVARSSRPQLDGYEIWFATENKGRIWSALLSAGAAAAGSEAIEQLRILRGLPRYGVDLRERDLPQETEQLDALNFAKGCYIGQEIVERIRARGNVHRTFIGFEVQGNPPAAGTRVRAGDTECGEITSSGRILLTEGDRVLALGYLRREAAIPGSTVQVGESSATVRPLPFPFEH